MKRAFKYVISVIIIIAVVLLVLGSIWFSGLQSIVEKLGGGNLWLGLLKIPFAIFGAIQVLRAFGHLIARDLEGFSSKWIFPIYFIATIVGIAVFFL